MREMVGAKVVGRGDDDENCCNDEGECDVDGDFIFPVVMHNGAVDGRDGSVGHDDHEDDNADDGDCAAKRM